MSGLWIWLADKVLEVVSLGAFQAVTWGMSHEDGRFMRHPLKL